MKTPRFCSQPVVQGLDTGLLVGEDFWAVGMAEERGWRGWMLRG